MHPLLNQIIQSQNPSQVILENQKEIYAVMPEIAALHGRIQPPQHHPEGSVDVHVRLVINRAVELGADNREIWGAFIHDLGKGVTPENDLPRHINHEVLGVPLVRTLGERLGVEEDWITFGQLCARDHLNVHKFLDLRPVKKVDLIRRLGDYVNDVALVAQADAQGRGPTFINRPYPQGQALIDAAAIVNKTRTGTVEFTMQFWTGLKDKPQGWFDEQIRRECAKAIAGKFGK
jgi:tRNA nucleotidyltransferase (CCA-adding enzyme)